MPTLRAFVDRNSQGVLWNILVETLKDWKSQPSHLTSRNHFTVKIVKMAVETIPNKELDKWIENLSNCKQLEEIEVKRLTDKVSW